jgi:hypothetical protein
VGFANFFFFCFSFRQHILTDAVRLVNAFKADKVPSGPDLFYANVTSSLSLIKTSLYLIITVIYDAFIVSLEPIFSRFSSAHPLAIIASASSLLDRLGPQDPRDLTSVPGFPC